MKRILGMVTVVAVLLLAGFVHAETFTLNGYSITANNSDPGLAVQTGAIQPAPASWNLNVGESVTFNLFRIWTNESAVNPDDLVSKPISVAFTWTDPTGTMPNSANGTTRGYASWPTGFFQDGRVTWDGPAYFDFGNGGLFDVALSDATFNEGSWWGLDEGRCYGANITATLTFDRASVPEPATLLLLGLGLVGLSGIKKRLSR